jgi:biotin carboxyl carrier protein
MTQDTRRKAIDDARALLDALIAHGWQEAHVVSSGTELFIATPNGGANPMRQVAATVEPPGAITEQVTMVTAPYVATLMSLLSIGTVVEPGVAVARLRVLDREHDLSADCAGRIAAVHAEPGTLLEFGMAVLSIARDAAE